MGPGRLIVFADRTSGVGKFHGLTVRPALAMKVQQQRLTERQRVDLLFVRRGGRRVETDPG